MQLSSAGPRRSSRLLLSVMLIWAILLVVAVAWGPELNESWAAWSMAFGAFAVWGVNLLLIYYGMGPPFAISRLPLLSATFALLMTIVGAGSYWATTQLFPLYRVSIERAALFVALCTMVSLLGCMVISRAPLRSPHETDREYVWDWRRLRIAIHALAVACVLGTIMTIGRIGYVPLLSGDPEAQRVEFPSIAGAWFRLAMLGIVVGLLAGAQICGGRATPFLWCVGVLSLLCASLYGNRFFAALPVGAVVVLWDRVRGRISPRIVALGLVVGAPILALLYFWRQQDQSVGLLDPLGLVLYGSLSEFRDLAWTLDYYSNAHPLLHGSTLGGLVVPLLPGPVWSVLGIDKAAVFANSNAAVLAEEMGQLTAQRVGIYGELFMNFGWIGALSGAFVYGAGVAYVDRGLLGLRHSASVRGILLAVVAAALIYAQVGQWNMLTATITGSCYPILLVALLAARRARKVL